MTTSAAEGYPSLSHTAAGRIRGLRAELGLNQTKLALRVGMTRTALSDREAGVKPVNVDELPAFADALGTSIEYLLGLTNDRSPRRIAPSGGSMFVMPERTTGLSAALRACRDSNPKPSDP
jgi:transcriptional regulator with XRE-family HTH domain